MIGLEVGMGSYGTNDIVNSLRPIYGTPTGDVLGAWCGINQDSLITVRAKGGYAIGTLTLKMGLLPNGLSVTFMRLRDGKLDPKDAYESRWVGTNGGAEGKVGKGWYVLFRSNDPSLWNTRTGKETADKYAVPLWTAHSKIRCLRLTRLDTKEALIIPITYEQLDVAPTVTPKKGFGWNGSKDLYYKGRHLGIFQATPGVPRGEICIDSRHSVYYLGSGFGHKAFFDDVQNYAWKGREIPKTVFEIAVSANELSQDEKTLLVAARPGITQGQALTISSLATPRR